MIEESVRQDKRDGYEPKHGQQGIWVMVERVIEMTMIGQFIEASILNIAYLSSTRTNALLKRQHKKIWPDYPNSPSHENHAFHHHPNALLAMLWIISLSFTLSYAFFLRNLKPQFRKIIGTRQQLAEQLKMSLAENNDLILLSHSP